MPPVYLTSTYAQTSPGVHQGYEYTRSHNPTRYAFERSIARLEGSRLTEADDVSYGGFAFSSGLAAIATLLDTLTAGDHVVAMDDLYGGTHRLFNQVRARSAGLRFTTVDMTVPGALEEAIQPDTKLVWVESPTNPTLKIVDLPAVAALCRDRGIMSACDNTFASPMIQRPIELGFDVTMHSATKYLGGHSDSVGGVLVTGDKALWGLATSNLVENALKYSEGKVHVHVFGTPGSAAIEVRDEGQGIPAGRRMEALEPFMRLSEEGQGTGLGLHLVSQTAELHGASLEMEDLEPSGFAVRLVWPQGR